MKKTLFFMMLFCVALNVKAQTATWIGGNGSWNDSVNWDVNYVPGSSNDVIIPTASTVMITAAATVKSITVNGTSTIGIAANITFTQASQFGSNTTINWSAGSLLGGGTLTNMGSMNILSNSNKGISGATTVSNTGTINFTGNGDLSLSNSSLNNLATGVVNFPTDGTTVSFNSSATELFNNAGTINRTTTTGLVEIGCTFTNSGTINVQTGTLKFSDGDNHFNGGVYNVAQNAILQCNGTIGLSGTLTGILNGTFNWAANFSVPTTATLNFTGTAPVYWNSGTLIGGGTLTQVSTLTLSTATDKSITGNTTLSNLGTVNVASTGDFYLSNSTFNNQLSGTLNFLADDGNLTFFSSSTEMLNNYGTINRSGAAGLVTISATMNNTGTINVTSGTLEISDTSSQLNGGVYNVNTGCILRWSQTINCSGTLTGVLEGPIEWIGNMSVIPANPATFNFTGSNKVNWNSGSLLGAGILTNKGKLLLTTTSNKTISGTTLDNEGSMTLENSGSLFLSNATVNNRTTGVMNLASDAASLSFSSSVSHVINNYGLLTKNIQNGISVIETTVNNYGMIDASLGTIRFDGNLNNTITGTVKGVATIDLPVAANLTNDGIFSPGGTPGKLNVIGNYESTNSSQLDVDLNGLTSITQFDLMAIQGNAIMKGVVNITLGFAPAIGNQFIIATTTGTITECTLAATSMAIFGNSQYTFNVACIDDNKVVLTLASILATNSFAFENTLKLYPNPATGSINLQNESGKTLTLISISDISGRNVMQLKPQNSTLQKIDLGNLTSGTYLVKITSGNDTAVKKIIVE